MGNNINNRINQETPVILVINLKTVFDAHLVKMLPAIRTLISKIKSAKEDVQEFTRALIVK
jgi:hypothetical protein